MQPKKRTMGSLGLASYTKKKNQTKEREYLKSRYKITVKRRSLREIKIIRHVLQIAKISEKLEKCFEFFVCTFVYS
jgi:hypothetical protein